MSMGWCLQCHTHPEENLRPLAEVTNMTWVAPESGPGEAIGVQLKRQLQVEPPKHCGGCHR